MDIQGLTASTMGILLDFVYTETVCVTVENVQELLPAACLLQLKGTHAAGQPCRTPRERRERERGDAGTQGTRVCRPRHGGQGPVTVGGSLCRCERVAFQKAAPSALKSWRRRRETHLVLCVCTVASAHRPLGGSRRTGLAEWTLVCL